MPDSPTCEARPSPRRTTLVLVVGGAGVGKTTLCHEVVKRVCVTYVDKDTLTHRLFPDTRSGEDYEAFRGSIYDTMWELVKDNLALGNSVLVDAPLMKEMQQDRWQQYLQTLLTDTNAQVRVVQLGCSGEELLHRLRKRDAPKDAKTIQNFEEHLRAEPIWLPIALHHVDINTENACTSNIELVIRFILDEDPAMDKDLFERLRVLWQGALDRFDKRRVYEWQACLAVWGAMIGLMIAVLSAEAIIEGWLAKGLLCLVGTGFAAMMTWWIANLKKRNDSDRDNADYYWDSLRKMVPIRLPAKQESEIVESRKCHGLPFWHDWNHVAQVLMTWLLWASLVIVVLWSVRQPASKGGMSSGNETQSHQEANQ
jgi:predicted kinase